MTCPDCGHKMVLRADRFGRVWMCTSCPYEVEVSNG